MRTFLLLSLLLPLLCAADERPERSDFARIAKIWGAKAVSVTRGAGATKGKVTELPEGEQLHVGDTIETGPKMRADLVFWDASRQALGPETKLTLESRKPGKQDFATWTFELAKGKVLGTVPPQQADATTTTIPSKQALQAQANAPPKLKIRTPVAVMGVRGTEYEFSHIEAAKKTEIKTIKGEVLFGRNKNFPAGSYVVVKAGERASLEELKAEKGKTAEPVLAKAILMTDDEKKALQKEWTPEDTPEAKKEVPSVSSESCRTQGLGWTSDEGNPRLGKCVAEE